MLEIAEICGLAARANPALGVHMGADRTTSDAFWVAPAGSQAMRIPPVTSWECPT